jgi:ubiquinone/menaquinone biosynthesis C-methylase UbiE
MSARERRYSSEIGPEDPMISGLMRMMHAPIYRSRVRALVDAIVPHLNEGERVLDVGCGGGGLGAAIVADPRTPAGVRIEGVERAVRGGEPIPVIGYQGGRIPLEDAEADVVILADVLHHEEDERTLLLECLRVCGRLLVIKDHVVQGPAAQQRISLIDWAANTGYGVPCLFRYKTPEAWRSLQEELELGVVEERLGMRLYPPGFEQLFGGGLQYFAALRVGAGPGSGATGEPGLPSTAAAPQTEPGTA